MLENFVGNIIENISNYYYKRKYGSTLVRSNISDSEFKEFRKNSKEVARYAMNRSYGGYWPSEIIKE